MIHDTLSIVNILATTNLMVVTTRSYQMRQKKRKIMFERIESQYNLFFRKLNCKTIVCEEMPSKVIIANHTNDFEGLVMVYASLTH